jgi:phage shock protein A
MMWAVTRKWWKYLGAKLGAHLEEVADPKVQLEQAIAEAQDRHRRLTEQAAGVIANQKQAERRLARAAGDYEKAKASARYALVLVDRETRRGDPSRATGFEQAATSFAGRLVTLERGVEDARRLVTDTTAAAEQAKAAVAMNSTLLEQKFAERDQLLSKLDQAKMQERVNDSVQQIGGTIGGDVPTLAQVERKIDGRLARAQGMAEIVGSNVDVRMLEVDRMLAEADARARLAELGAEMGLAPVRAAIAAAPEPEPERQVG